MKKIIFGFVFILAAGCATTSAPPAATPSASTEKEETFISSSVEERVLSSSQKIDGMLSLLYRLETKTPPVPQPPTIAGHNNLEARQAPSTVPGRQKYVFDEILSTRANILWVDRSSEELLKRITDGIKYKLIIKNDTNKKDQKISFESKNLTVEEILQSLANKMSWVDMELNMKSKTLLIIYK